MIPFWISDKLMTVVSLGCSEAQTLNKYFSNGECLRGIALKIL